jgi:hypothetical protein
MLHARFDVRCRRLPVALRVGAALDARVQLEALDELVAPPRVEAAAQPAQQVDRLAARQVRPQRDVARHVREPPVQRDGVAPRVAAQQPDVAGVGAQQAEQHADRRRLPRAVGPEEPVHLAGRDVEVEAVERAPGAVALDEARDGDRLRHARSLGRGPPRPADAADDRTPNSRDSPGPRQPRPCRWPGLPCGA